MSVTPNSPPHGQTGLMRECARQLNIEDGSFASEDPSLDNSWSTQSDIDSSGTLLKPISQLTEILPNDKYNVTTKEPPEDDAHRAAEGLLSLGGPETSIHEDEEPETPYSNQENVSPICRPIRPLQELRDCYEFHLTLAIGPKASPIIISYEEGSLEHVVKISKTFSVPGRLGQTMYTITLDRQDATLSGRTLKRYRSEPDSPPAPRREHNCRRNTMTRTIWTNQKRANPASMTAQPKFRPPDT